MKGLTQLLRDALPEIIAGLAVAAVLTIIGLLYTYLGLSVITVLVAVAVIVAAIGWFLLSRRKKRAKSSVTILLVDNDSDFVDTRKLLLEREGYNVIAAFNTADARRVLDKGIVDLAMLDVRLLDDESEKDITGLALAKSPAYRNIPKIILTAYASPDILRESIGQESIVDFLSKLEGPETMILSVKRALSLSGKH